MPTTIKLKNSVTTTNAPSSLAQGEVAINITDKKVWVGNAATTPIQLVGDGGSASFTSIAFGAGTVTNPSITFTGDTNTGIFSPAADTIAFTEGGVEAMRIDSSGNVGIGTATPSKKLEVYTSANSLQIPTVLRNDNAGTGIAALGFNVSASPGETTSTKAGIGQLRQASFGRGPIVFYNNNTGSAGDFTTADEKMRIGQDGRVQIGAANPFTSFFSVQGGSGSEVVAYFGSSNANLTAMAVRNDPSNNTTMLSSEWSTTATNLLLGLGGTERMRFNPSGNTLVGTSVDAGGKFQVANLASTGLVALFTGDNVNGNSDGIVLTYNSAGVANYRVQLAMNTYNGIINMRDSSNTQTVRIHAAGATYFNGGNFGIGNTNPDAKLHITAGGTNIRIDGSTIWRQYGATDGAGIHFTGGALFPANYNGNIVDNAIQFGSGGYRFTALYAVNGTIQTSDRNEKQDIEDLTEAELKVAKKIKPLIKKFKFKDAVAKKGDAARIHIGVIAQEIEDAFASEGLDANKYGMFCEDSWYEVNGQKAPKPEEPFTAETPNAVKVTRKGVRYDELLAFVIAAI
jgi:hypothetical protein